MGEPVAQGSLSDRAGDVRGVCRVFLSTVWHATDGCFPTRDMEGSKQGDATFPRLAHGGAQQSA